MHYVKYWMKKRSIHRGYYGHLLRIFFCYLHLGKRDEAADFTENRHFCSDDEATLEEVMLALYDWRQSKIKAETETFVAFEETLANSIPGSYFERYILIMSYFILSNFSIYFFSGCMETNQHWN